MHSCIPLHIPVYFQTLPVLPKNGWNIEKVCQGIRTHSRFFPSLVTSSSTSLVAATTLLDSKVKVLCIHCQLRGEHLNAKCNLINLKYQLLVRVYLIIANIIFNNLKLIYNIYFTNVTVTCLLSPSPPSPSM